MKFSTPVVLALATAPVVTANPIVDACYSDPDRGEVHHELVATTTASADMEEWYGFIQNAGNTGLDRFSANTPSDVESQNEDKVGFIPVYFGDDGVGLAMILDKPNDNEGGKFATKIECTGEGCGSFPGLGFFSVFDDQFGNDKYKSFGGALYSAHDWQPCCTDGFATEPLGCAEVCVTVLGKAEIEALNVLLIADADQTKIDSNRVSDPLGLSAGVGVYDEGTDSGGGMCRTLKPDAPVPGDKFCFKTCGGMGGGDPHFKTFGGKWYDFMGACDLVLVDAPNFTRDAGLRVDIRTAIRYTYSYIESAVLALGEDTFEVSSFGQYAVNGVSNADLPATLNGFTITHTQPSEKIHIFKVEISKSEHIIIKTLKDMVSVNWGMLLNHRMNGARGMLGDAGNGKMLGRNGTVAFEDPIEFAAEWQVREDEAMNFMTSRAPQHPAQCVMPDTNAAEKKRRLGESIAIEAAEKACSNWDPEMRAACVHDVIATGDLELAEAGAF